MRRFAAVRGAGESREGALMSVTAAPGFAAAGVSAGIRPSGKPDVALVRALVPAVGSAMVVAPSARARVIAAACPRAAAGAASARHERPTATVAIPARPRARGRFGKIMKPFSQLTIVLRDQSAEAQTSEAA
mgnify:CR=1 FL=1